MRKLHKTTAIPLTDGQRILIKFMEMIEHLVEPHAQYFGEMVIDAFIDAGVIRDDGKLNEKF